MPNHPEPQGACSTPLSAPLTFEFSGRAAKNRFLKAAISERLATWDPKEPEGRGFPTKELINVYRKWGEGGFGVILTGNIMFEFDQLEAAGNPIIPRGSPFSGERFDAFEKLATEAKKQGSLIIAQLNHPGRQVKSSIQMNPISASDVQLKGKAMGMTFEKPRPMEKNDFDAVIAGFAHAAEYCYRAGYDGVQLHAAHGYLLAQFLAPSTNSRTDKYGGGLANRSRLIFEISDAIRARIPDKSFILSIKVNSVEFEDGGFSTDDCKSLCVQLERHGFDFVELSGGTYQTLGFTPKRESTKKREAFFQEFADVIIPELKITKCYLTGGLRTVAGMMSALEAADGVGLARPICHEFDLAQKMLTGKVTAARDCLIDEQSFALTSVAAGTQYVSPTTLSDAKTNEDTRIRLVGKGEEPLDLSKTKDRDTFRVAMRRWLELGALDKDNSRHGFIDIERPRLELSGTICSRRGANLA
ncbi:hypothetical protein QQZ08_009234 [Neonectria magnoliae]|uniref:NADH:flavin oxidoreductase/NADH oxidase N-terminal domain-containing protein n=1 Tax=Neonectria magnoliae TaxID=2732573 RepID=A0ABR1HPY8_9HYPO